MVRKLWLPSAFAMLACACIFPAFAAEKAVAVVPNAELEAEITAQIKDFETNYADESKFKAKANGRSAKVLAALAQALATSGEDSPMKKSAADVRDAALALSKAANVGDAKKALEEVKAATSKSSAKAEFDWTKIIDAHQLMEEVQSRNAKVGKAVRSGLAPDTGRHTLVLAVLGLPLEANAPEGKPDVEVWKKSSHDFTKGFADVTAAVKSGDAAKVKAAYTTTMKSCGACHEKFKDN